VLYDRRQVGLKPVPYKVPLSVDHTFVHGEHGNARSPGRVQARQQQCQLLADLPSQSADADHYSRAKMQWYYRTHLVPLFLSSTGVRLI
jgi:hypothetical protein